ncbi:MAG: transposase [Haliea sp.]|nr:transposase [Haliea sp.]
MDNEASLPKVIKRRRRHSPAFKQRVVDECRQPNTSIAEVALRHGLNLNQMFRYAPSREHRHVTTFLGEFQGTLLSGGYEAYAAYAKGKTHHPRAMLGPLPPIF